MAYAQMTMCGLACDAEETGHAIAIRRVLFQFLATQPTQAGVRLQHRSCAFPVALQAAHASTKSLTTEYQIHQQFNTQVPCTLCVCVTLKLVCLTWHVQGNG